MIVFIKSLFLNMPLKRTFGNVRNPIRIMIYVPKIAKVRKKDPKPLSIGKALLYSQAKYREAKIWIKSKMIFRRLKIL
jgi:hypothetical protein